MFGLRAWWRCGDARAEEQVGKLLGILESHEELFSAFIVKNVKFSGMAIGLELEKNSFPTGRDLCCLAGLDWV